MNSRALLLGICLLALAAASSLLQGEAPPPATRSDPKAADVRAFGARGDGQADDTAAIQKMVDAGTGSVRFPPGRYRLTRPVVIDLNKVGYTSLSGDGTAQIIMAGPGPAFRFVGTHARTAAPSTVKPNVWQNQRSPMVDGLEIIGEHSDACGIEATGTMQLTVTRVVVREAQHAIHLTGLNRNVIVSDCHLYNNRGIGVYYDDVNLHQSNITGSHISYNAGGGIVSRRGNVRNIHITGCDIEGNQGADQPPTANVLIDCTGSNYGTGEVAITGCTIQHAHQPPDSANIRIIGRSNPSRGQSLVREGNVTITGNVFSDVQVNIHLKDCRGVVVTGNNFWQGFTHNMLVEDCSSVIVGPNNFDRNPRYHREERTEPHNNVVFRNCRDCTLTGLHLTSIHQPEAALLIEDSERCHITGCTILDCGSAGLLLRNVSLSRVSDCLIRNDAPNGKRAPSLVVRGGRRNLITDNVVANGLDAEDGTAELSSNHQGL